MIGEVMSRFMRKPIAVFGAVILIILLVACLLAPVLAPYDYDAQNIKLKFTAPCREFICGTDNLGRDIFSRLLYGGRISCPYLENLVIKWRFMEICVVQFYRYM